MSAFCFCLGKKRYNGKCSAFILGSILFTGALWGSDGGYWRVGKFSSNYGNRGCNTDADFRFLYGTRASDGGILSVEPILSHVSDPSYGFALNEDGITLGGIDFRNTAWVIYSYDQPEKTYQMVGERPWVRATEQAYGPRLRVGLVGTGSNTLVKEGPAPLMLDRLLTQFRAVEIQDGSLISTNVAPSVMTEAQINSKGGDVRFRPTLSAGGSIAATAGSAGVAFTSDRGSIEVNRGGGASVQLSIGPLQVADDASLVIDAGEGGLGSTEKLLVTDRTSSPESGNIVARNLSTDNAPYSFLSYTTENGFVPEAKGNVVFDEERGAVLVNTEAVNGFTGNQNIDFGTTCGRVWKSTPAETIDMKTTISGTAGVVFLGRYAKNPASLAFYDGFAQWSGGTTLSGIRAVLKTAKPFPEDMPVRVVGTEKYGSAQLVFDSDLAAENDYEISGAGYDGMGAVYVMGPHAISFQGQLSLLDKSFFGASDPAASISFAQPIEGTGILAVTSGTVLLDQPNHYSGGTALSGGVLQVKQGGTLGTGRTEIKDGSLVLDGLHGDISSGIHASGGQVSLVNGAAVKLTNAESVFSNLSLEKGVELDVATDVKIADLDFPFGATIQGAGGTLTLDTDRSDSSLMGSLSDGEAPLSLTKAGMGNLSLSGTNAIGGAVRVEEGLLSFSPVNNILYSSSVSWHLDASDPSTVLSDRDGRVTNWVSVSSEKYSFVDTGLGSTFPTYGVRTVNGLPTVSFVAEEQNRLAGKTEAVHRTIAIAVMPRNLPGYQYSELFGNNGQDIGLRVDPDYETAHKPFWNYKSSPATFAQGDYIYLNGEKLIFGKTSCSEASAAFAANDVHILVVDHETDNRDSLATFVPSIGGYSELSNKRSFAGEVGEVIAFNRVLTDVERKYVQNYLAKKWGASERGFDPEVSFETAPAPLKPTATIDLAQGGTLDLGGCDVTVSTLLGEGHLENRSSRTSILTVADASHFSGTIGKGIVLKASGNLVLAQRAGGSIHLAAGSSELQNYQYQVPTNGLLYHLDASESDSLIVDAETGSITNWLSQGGRISGFGWQASYVTDKWQADPPTISNDIEGKPSVRCWGNQGLRASDQSLTKTIIIVGKYNDWNIICQGLWGVYETDCGVRFIDRRILETGYASSYFNLGSTIRINGTDYSQTVSFPLTTEQNEPFIATFACIPQNGQWPRNNYNALNCYFENRGGKNSYGEILAWDRILSIEEIKNVENYLRDKWFSSAAIPQSSTSIVIDRVEPQIGSDGLVDPVVLRGDVSLADQAVLSLVGNAKPARSKQLLFSADGNVSGDFSEVVIPEGATYRREMNRWDIFFTQPFLLMLR